MNIVNFVKGLLPSLDKSEVETEVEVSLNSVEIIMGVYTSLGEVFKVSPPASKENQKLIKVFYDEMKKSKFKTKLNARKSLPEDMVTLFGNVKVNGDFVFDKIGESLNDVVISRALSAYKANILRSGGHLYFITRYAMDLANYIYTLEVENSSTEVDSDFLLNKKQRVFVEDNMWIFARLLSVYGDVHEEFKKKIDLLGDVVLNEETSEIVTGGYEPAKLDIFNTLPDGFIGSPIYTVRMVFAQWEADRYKSLKDKKRLMELRYLHLMALKDQGNSDIGVEKEINYLQKQVTDMDYKLSKIERSIA